MVGVFKADSTVFIVDLLCFITCIIIGCTFPDFQEPYAIVVLLLNDLVVVDLTSPG